ncbi:MAG: hypothetical protein IT204_09485 [Fimbriimonadaceae bacterium]|nr:hypothetical protein [Fimbriimonadaceae bacterium]
MSEASKTKLGGLIMAAGIGLGVLLVIVEFLNGPRGEAQPGLFGIVSPHMVWAERAFIFLFGVVHLIVAAIITVFRRTAV